MAWTLDLGSWWRCARDGMHLGCLPSGWVAVASAVVAAVAVAGVECLSMPGWVALEVAVAVAVAVAEAVAVAAAVAEAVAVAAWPEPVRQKLPVSLVQLGLKIRG